MKPALIILSIFCAILWWKTVSRFTVRYLHE